MTATRAVTADNDNSPASEPSAAAEADTGQASPATDPGSGAGDLGLAAGERGVALTRPLAMPPLAIGDVVELVAVASDGSGGATAQTIGPPVRVVAIDDASITVAVPAQVAPVIVDHQATGPIELVLTP